MKTINNFQKLLNQIWVKEIANEKSIKASQGLQFILYCGENQMNPYQGNPLFYYQYYLYQQLLQPPMVYCQPMPGNNQFYITSMPLETKKNPFQEEQIKLTQLPSEKSQVSKSKGVVSHPEQIKPQIQNSNKNSLKQEEQNLEQRERKKPKRPQTYLTEKAYYMKQKIKGKTKNGIRILRNRNSEKSEGKGKKILRSAKSHKIKKQKIVGKESEEAKAIRKRISEMTKAKAIEEYVSPEAILPKRLMGEEQIKKFMNKKVQSLNARRVHSCQLIKVL